MGLILRGGFHPVRADGVPVLPDGSATRTVVLVGNAGRTLWWTFRGQRVPLRRRHPLDGWLEPVIREAATSFGAHPLFPRDGPPFPPIQRWAQRAEPVHPSPLGLLIHPEYGLWHAYRSALLFPEKLRLPARENRPRPCDSCAAKPCLTACPVDAFDGQSFAVDACTAHVTGETGGACRNGGCLARLACPVGRSYVYHPEQARFHMGKFLESMAERAVAPPTRHPAN